jgi:hypothetical protein
MNKKGKEGIILAAVAVVGIGGLILLQVLRSGSQSASDDRALVQNQQQLGAQPGTEDQRTIQQIPGNLLRENEQPEAERPFLFELSDFSTGAVYSLDPGDGNPRQTFTNGRLNYVYAKEGAYMVRIFASYNGTEVLLKTVTKVVAHKIKVPTQNKKTGKPIIDF